MLIAGPTASGKSALAIALAQGQGGVIVNADALQVWSCWRIISARPSIQDEAEARHLLYGHMQPGAPYSVGQWLDQVAEILSGGERLIVVGGTGLYLHALSNGLAVIPPVPDDIRAEGNAIIASPDGMSRMVAALDPRTHQRIDLRNPARVQRAWEVLRATGRGIADWQAETGPALIPPAASERIVLNSDRDWLAERIDRRFRLMMQQGALEEVREMLPHWEPTALWARAIGAPELVAYLSGDMSLDEAVERAIIASRQYAKSQRIFFRGRMKDWRQIPIGPAA
ncbi:tRNA (adenosine(37)-N6)-dimethylallyltransferase MiaA [Paracoccus sp. MBLB3053]|uniref:tRNA dimethylallyltransferase n=1 Tax=Paracoccus aurantius TaxID=3073814 RepID=A0ABU2HV26_9RHOB|nr:tRNA (adenosine(37)-N6)-dimethylallyltransferase MiaA [Paracoccus sp. MBLB3053]MDS9468124.1 tRNA (adenosine(37)-N6)-dimethylallyltransferase MiaA [Paracoccus sp. MBLB3053]